MKKLFSESNKLVISGQKGKNRMKKVFSKLYILLGVIILVFSTSCQSSNSKNQEETALPSQASDTTMQEETGNTCKCSYEEDDEDPSTTSKLPNEEKIEETTTEPSVSDKENLKESGKVPADQNEETKLDIELPNGAFIIEVSRDSDGNQNILALKDEFLQIWCNQTMICEKKIPTPANISIGSNLYEIFGNPYISKKGELVLIQSYTNLDDEPKLAYTILAKNCEKIISSLAYDGYVFKNSEGKYAVVFYKDDFPWYPYGGLGFSIADSYFPLPEPTTIWLNESTVKSVSFRSWGTTSYGYQDVSAIAVRLEVEDYGTLDISHACEPFEPIEVDRDFFELLHEDFSPNEYEERFASIVQALNKYN